TVEETGLDLDLVLAPYELDAFPGELPALEVDSESPYLLTYTSGTTDVSKGDVVHFATDMGWIMGPWTLVGAGALGATIVFAEGAPDWPADRLWRIIEEESVTMLGCSPTLIRALIPHGDPAA